MLSKQYMAWGAIVVSVLITATEFLALPNWLNYVWALLVLLWGVLALTGK